MFPNIPRKTSFQSGFNWAEVLGGYWAERRCLDRAVLSAGSPTRRAPHQLCTAPATVTVHLNQHNGENEVFPIFFALFLPPIT